MGIGASQNQTGSGYIHKKQVTIYTYIYIPPLSWSPFGMIMGHSGEEFWEARWVKNQLLTVVESCVFTLRPKGVLATFTFPVFSVSSPRGSSLGFFAHSTPPKKIPPRRIIVDSPRSTLRHSAASSLFSLPLEAEWLDWLC